MNSLSQEESLDEMALPEVEPVRMSMSMCSVCGVADDRPLLRFLPDPSRAYATPSCCLDIALHLFCGKTAAILKEQPSLEILTKAGLKNKHGIGPEIMDQIRADQEGLDRGAVSGVIDVAACLRGEERNVLL